ncbi:MAG TPA: heavy metal-binding domain-containing protein [Bacteroidia bacterium]|nr:heavy metal-binding domain-containing protein [Bacteroidia bacterium]
MKNKIILSATLFLMLSIGCKNSNNQTGANKTDSTSQTFNLDTTKLKTGDVYYQCEMHPEVISDKSGSCPKCGMDLSEIKKQ